MVKKGKLWICDRCGRTQFQERMKSTEPTIELYKPMDPPWLNGLYNTLCPACEALVESARKSIIAGKSVSIPSLENKALKAESVDENVQD